MKLKCESCGYEWEYGGSMKVKTTCPDCQTKVVIGRCQTKTKR